MKRIITMLTLILCSHVAHAQSTIINGDFEPTAGTPPSCTWVTMSEFHSFIGHWSYTWIAFFPNREDTISASFKKSNSCSEGAAKSGNYSLQLMAGATPNVLTQTNVVVLKLSQPMWANYRYTVEFSQKRSTGGSVNVGLHWGYSNDSTEFGTLYDSSAKTTGTSWETKTMDIKPPVDAKYLTFRAYKNGPDGTGHILVDDFKITQVVNVEGVEAPRFSISPNPATNTININNAATGSRLFIYDIVGKTVYTGAATKLSETINISGLAAGSYFVEVNNDGVRAFEKLVKH